MQHEAGEAVQIHRKHIDLRKGISHAASSVRPAPGLPSFSVSSATPCPIALAIILRVVLLVCRRLACGTPALSRKC